MTNLDSIILHPVALAPRRGLSDVEVGEFLEAHPLVGDWRPTAEPQRSSWAFLAATDGVALAPVEPIRWERVESHTLAIVATTPGDDKVLFWFTVFGHAPGNPIEAS